MINKKGLCDTLVLGDFLFFFTLSAGLTADVVILSVSGLDTAELSEEKKREPVVSGNCTIHTLFTDNALLEHN